MLSDLKEYSEQSLGWKDTLTLKEMIEQLLDQCLNPSVNSEDYFSIIVNRKLDNDQEKIEKFSKKIADFICAEYGLELDDEAKTDVEIVYDIYKFFVLNSKTVLQTFLYNYLCRNAKKDSFIKTYNHLRTDVGDNRNVKDSIIISGLPEILKDIAYSEFTITDVIDEIGGKSESDLYKRILKYCRKNVLESDTFVKYLYKKNTNELHCIRTVIMIKYTRNYMVSATSPFVFEDELEVQDPDGLENY